MIVAACLSYFPLEVPSHREDIKITTLSNLVGYGLFDHPAVLFAAEEILFVVGMWIYAYLRILCPSF